MATMIGTIRWQCLNHGSMEPARSQMKSLLVKHVRVTIKKTEIKFQIFYSTIRDFTRVSTIILVVIVHCFGPKALVWTEEKKEREHRLEIAKTNCTLNDQTLLEDLKSQDHDQYGC